MRIVLVFSVFIFSCYNSPLCEERNRYNLNVLYPDVVLNVPKIVKRTKLLLKSEGESVLVNTIGIDNLPYFEYSEGEEFFLKDTISNILLFGTMAKTISNYFLFNNNSEQIKYLKGAVSNDLSDTIFNIKNYMNDVHLNPDSSITVKTCNKKSY